MIFDVAENLFGEGVAERAGERNEHAFAEGCLQKTVHDGDMVMGERKKVIRRRAEAEDDGQLQQKPYMEIAEVGLHGIQQEDVLLAPFKKTLFRGAVLDRAVQDFAEEKGDGILADAVADADKGMS